MPASFAPPRNLGFRVEGLGSGALRKFTVSLPWAMWASVSVSGEGRVKGSWIVP